MKKYLLSTLIAAAATGCTTDGSTRLSLNGSVEGTDNGKVYLQKFDNKIFRTVDSAEIKDGRFSFSSKVELPEVYGLTLDTTKNQLFVFLDGAATTVRLDPTDGYSKSVVEGSELHDLFTEYKKDRDVRIDEFIKSHPGSLVAAYALYRDFSYRLSSDEIRANLELLDPSLSNTQYVRVLHELADVMETVAVGRQAPDFTVADRDGNPVRLADHLGKGYVLIDFWAAWCGPCRRENPNVVKAYNQYKDRGFDVIGVSLDKSKDAWIAAIEKDSLTWTHVSDLLYWNSAPAKLYGVRAIPANVLVDKNGIIVARNIRGEALGKTLDELLNTSN